jgi:hypothetical protein
MLTYDVQLVPNDNTYEAFDNFEKAKEVALSRAKEFQDIIELNIWRPAEGWELAALVNEFQAHPNGKFEWLN